MKKCYVFLGADPMRIGINDQDTPASILDLCYKVIRCDCVETVRSEYLGDQYRIIVDECGMYSQTPRLNVFASWLYGMQSHGQPLVGNAIILKLVETEDGPDLALLDPEEAEKIYEDLRKHAAQIITEIRFALAVKS